MTKIVLAFIVLAGFRGCTAHTHTISCGDLHTENKCESAHGCWWMSKWRGNREYGFCRGNIKDDDDEKRPKPSPADAFILKYIKCSNYSKKSTCEQYSSLFVVTACHVKYHTISTFDC